jgi:hypothetical protein
MHRLAFLLLCFSLFTPSVANANPVPAFAFEDAVVLVASAAARGDAAAVVAAIESYAASVGATGAGKVNIATELTAEVTATRAKSVGFSGAAVQAMEQAVTIIRASTLTPIIYIKDPRSIPPSDET